MNKFRTHTCADISENDIDKVFYYRAGFIESVIMAITFIDLRDHYGNSMCNRK